MGAIFGWTGAAPLDPRLAQQRLAHRGSGFRTFAIDADNTLAVIAGETEGRYASHDGVFLVMDGCVHGVAGKQDTLEYEPPSDAWQLLRVYLQHGAEGLDAIHGEYAIALYDSRSREMLLGRDRTGARPLYFTTLPDGTAYFASEYKALLAADTCDNSYDLEMVQRLQQYKHLPSNRTLLKSIRAVEPGTLMKASRGTYGVVARLRRPTLALVDEPPQKSEQRICASFMSAVETCLGDRRRVGVALSGGVDSIAVAFACRKLRPQQALHTFTAGSGPEDPEIRTAALVSERLGAVHHPVYVSPEDITRALPLVVWHAENPIARSEIVQFFKLGWVAKDWVELLLTGMGADGLYAGMPSDKVLWLYSMLPPLRPALHEFYAAAQSGRPPQSMAGQLLSRLYFGGPTPPVPRVAGAPCDQSLPALPPLTREFLNNFLCGSFCEGLTQRLPKVERMLSAFGVEFTSPYIDGTVVDTAFTIPAALKMRFGKEKYILRRAMRSLVSPELLAIPKFPMRMAYDGAFADQLDVLAAKYLSTERVRARGLFVPTSIDVARRYRGRGRYHPEAALRLWTAVLTEIWAEQFVDWRGARATATPVPSSLAQSHVAPSLA